MQVVRVVIVDGSEFIRLGIGERPILANHLHFHGAYVFAEQSNVLVSDPWG